MFDHDPLLLAYNYVLTDRPLQALKVVEQNEGEVFDILRDKLRSKLDHVINPEVYKSKYRDDPMSWRPENVWSDRYGWVFNEIIETNAKTYLDLGCYEGTLVIQAHRRLGVESHGVEINKEAVKWNRSKINKGENIHFYQSAIEDFKTRKKFDVVSCLEVIEHVPDDTAIFKKMLSLVNKNGVCMVSTPLGVDSLHQTVETWETEGKLIDHVRSYTKPEVEEILSELDCEYDVKENVGTLYISFKKKGV